MTAGELDATRVLMRAFVAWRRGRHQQDLHLIDRYFDAAEFERELADPAALYRKLGFQPTAPYYDMPDDVRDWLVFLRRDI